MTLAFDVNDAELRRELLQNRLEKVIDGLEENTEPLWGRMSAQHMIEHLVWTFQASRGAVELSCDYSSEFQNRMKRFLYNNRDTTQLFKNPVLPDHPQALQYSHIKSAKAALGEEIGACFKYYRKNPEAMHVHPLFGLIGREEWERTHYKHCFHHLLQFGLIDKGKV